MFELAADIAECVRAVCRQLKSKWCMSMSERRTDTRQGEFADSAPLKTPSADQVKTSIIVRCAVMMAIAVKMSIAIRWNGEIEIGAGFACWPH